MTRGTRPPVISQSEEECEALAQFGVTPRRITAIRRVYKVETSEGTFALKRSRQTQEELLFIHAAKEYLYQQGMDNISRYRLSRNGRPYAQVGESLYVLSPWTESREGDYTSLHDLIPAARNLARLHRSSRGFIPPAVSDRIKWGTWPHAWEKRLQELREDKDTARTRSPQTPFDRRFLNHVDHYYRQGQEALRLLQHSHYEELCNRYRTINNLCHHDYSERNVLFTKAGAIHIVDFDYCICDLPIHDVVNFLRRVVKFTHHSVRIACQVLNAYLSENPLTPEELQLFVPLWCWPQKFWEVAHQYYQEQRVRPARKYYNRLCRRSRGKKRERYFLQSIIRAYNL